VGEDGGDGEAAGALDIHEERARAGHKHLLGLSARDLVVTCCMILGDDTYLQLVLAGLSLRGGV
jgi:hypothetical protein